MTSAARQWSCAMHSFADLASLSLRLKATSSRLAGYELVGSFLRELDPEEIRPAVLMLLGRVRPPGSPPLEVSGATLTLVLRTLAPVAVTAGKAEDLAQSFRARLEGTLPETPRWSVPEVHRRLLAVAAQD